MTNQEQQQVYKQLRSITRLKELLSDIEDKICDIRVGDYTQESRQLALQIFRDELKDKIYLNKPDDVENVLSDIGE